jgi:hypothetical protein
MKGADLAPTKEDVISSNPAASHIDPGGFKLVRDISRSAGLRGSKSDASSNVKPDASVFLTAEFQSVLRRISAFKNSLAKRQRSATKASLDLQPKGNAIDRWQAESGR